jgi:hypothetical protein
MLNKPMQAPDSSTLLPSPVRRALLLATTGALLSACGFGAKRIAAEPARPLSAEDEQLKRKFRGLQGGQLRVDSLFQVRGLNIFDEDGHLFFAHSRLTPPDGRITGSYGADFGVPKLLRFEWRDKIEMESRGALKRGLPDGAYYGGNILGNYTVPVASRIPDALLEDKRRNGGGFRLKIRIHPDGPLIGWDLERAPGSAPDGSKFHHAGGDFQEAHIYQGKVLRKGWYIHPRTAERIETDF